MNFEEIREGDYCYDMTHKGRELRQVMHIQDGIIELDNHRIYDKSNWLKLLWKVDISKEVLPCIGFTPSDSSEDPMEFKCSLLGCNFVLKRIDPKIGIIKEGEFAGCKILEKSENGLLIRSWTLSCSYVHDIDGGESKVISNLLFLHELQHIVKDYVDKQIF